MYEKLCRILVLSRCLQGGSTIAKKVLLEINRAKCNVITSKIGVQASSCVPALLMQNDEPKSTNDAFLKKEASTWCSLSLSLSLLVPFLI